jgi:HSP20 family protein
MAGFGVVIETYHVSPVRNPSFMQQRQAQAEYKDGILTLTLPKVEAVRNTVVKINLGDQEIQENTESEQSSEQVAAQLW